MRMRLELVRITSMLLCASLIISADALAQKSKRKKSKPADQSIVLSEGGFSRYDYNWLSFTGKDLEVIVDLEEMKTVHRIESAYYQYGFWLRLFPKRVEYYVSTDGNNFEQVRSAENTLPIDQYGGQQRDFISEFAPKSGRYIKVKAYTIGNTPEWHPGAGRPANMLIDEIVVE